MTFATEGIARQEAVYKVWEKQAKGYVLAYSV
jgi:hypothetical protein